MYAEDEIWLTYLNHLFGCDKRSGGSLSGKEVPVLTNRHLSEGLLTNCGNANCRHSAADE